MISLRRFGCVRMIAIAGALCSAMVTVSASAGGLNSGGRSFTLVVVVWGCLPYAATAWLCSLKAAEQWRSVLSYGLLAYAVVDIASRVQAFYFPTGSTDSLVALFLPVWSPLIILGIGSVSALALRNVERHG